MTYRNNFDTNSRGDDVEVTAYYSSQEALELFTNNIEILQHNGYRTRCKGFYIDHGNLPQSKEIDFKLVATDEQKQAWLEKEYAGYSYTPPLDDAEDLILSSYGERITLCNYQDASKQIAPMSIEPNKRVEWVTIRGYSQGDYADVAYCPDDFLAAWGNSVDEIALKTELTRLFYDAPIYCNVTINGNEYNYCDYMPDYYDWQPDEFARVIKEKTGCEIGCILPTQLDYI